VMRRKKTFQNFKKVAFPFPTLCWKRKKILKHFCFKFQNCQWDEKNVFDLERTSVGSNKPYRKNPWDFLRGKSKKYCRICRYYFSAPHPW
jgi:hypothetical protein